MFFKDFVSVKRQKIKRGASQTYDTPSFSQIFRLTAKVVWQEPKSGQTLLNLILHTNFVVNFIVKFEIKFVSIKKKT